MYEDFGTDGDEIPAFVKGGARGLRELLRGRAHERGRQAVDALKRERGAPWRLGPDHVAWKCPQCGEEKFADLQNGVHYETRYSCACMKARYAEVADAYFGEHRPRFAREAWERTEPPARFRDATFASFRARPGTRQALKRCEEYAAAFTLSEEGRSLFLLGRVGVGKTHLAIATARATVDRVLAQVAITSSAAIVSGVRGDGDRFDWKLVDRMVAAELLLLDDLGQESVTAWSRDLVYRVLDGRYQEGRPCVVTSNLGDAQLRDVYGEALVSRLYEMTDPVEINATDYRAELAKARGAA